MPEFPIMAPHEAGAQIRVLANDLYEVLVNAPTSSHATFQSSYEVTERWSTCNNAALALEVAIQSRKLTVMRPAFIAYKEAIRVYRNAVYLSATEQLSKKTASYPPTKKGTSVANAMKQIRDLANNLPTQPDMPSADSRDTALRAIIAVLRTHEIPGTENLTHHAKEDQSAKTESVVDQAAGGTVASAALDAAKQAGLSNIFTTDKPAF